MMYWKATWPENDHLLDRPFSDSSYLQDVQSIWLMNPHGSCGLQFQHACSANSKPLCEVADVLELIPQHGKCTVLSSQRRTPKFLFCKTFPIMNLSPFGIRSVHGEAEHWTWHWPNALRRGTSHPKNTKIFLLALPLCPQVLSVSSELCSLRLIALLKISFANAQAQDNAHCWKQFKKKGHPQSECHCLIFQSRSPGFHPLRRQHRPTCPPAFLSQWPWNHP